MSTNNITPGHLFAVQCFGLLAKDDLSYSDALLGCQQLFANVLKECFAEYQKKTPDSKLPYEEVLKFEMQKLITTCFEVKDISDEFYASNKKPKEQDSNNVVFIKNFKK